MRITRNLENKAKKHESKRAYSRIKIDEDIQHTKYNDVFSMGEYNNDRNNLYDYGFGDLKMLGSKLCFFNLDGKIKVFDV